MYLKAGIICGDELNNDLDGTTIKRFFKYNVNDACIFAVTYISEIVVSH